MQVLLVLLWVLWLLMVLSHVLLLPFRLFLLLKNFVLVLPQMMRTKEAEEEAEGEVLARY